MLTVFTSGRKVSVCAVDAPVKPLAGGKRSKKQKKKQRQQQAQMAAANVENDSDSEHDAAQQTSKPARAVSDSGAEEEASEEGQESEDAMLERMMQAANMGTPAQPSDSESVRHLHTIATGGALLCMVGRAHDHEYLGGMFTWLLCSCAA